MSKHTPGPWKWTSDLCLYGGNGWSPVLEARAGFRVDSPDARLIAVAPELLAALRFYCDNWCVWETTDNAGPPSYEPVVVSQTIEPAIALMRDRGQRARAAIARATGEDNAVD